MGAMITQDQEYGAEDCAPRKTDELAQILGWESGEGKRLWSVSASIFPRFLCRCDPVDTLRKFGYEMRGLARVH